MSVIQNVAALQPSVSNNSPSPAKDHIDQLRTELGHDVILLPIPVGTKRPAIKNWQKIDGEMMKDPEYLQTLREAGNTGVLLGSASGGLCAIDIDNNDAVEPFLALNPALRTTLRTRGFRGAQIWIRITGEFPKLTKLQTAGGEAWGEWRANGGQSVIRGVHPENIEYTRLHDAAPISLGFEDIKWPENLVLPWIRSDFDIVEEEEGPPFITTERGVNVNQMFFVRKFMLEHHVLYDASLGDFFMYQPQSGIWEVTSTDTIKRLFLDDLKQVANTTDLKHLHHRRTDASANSLMALLRVQVETRDAFSKRQHAIHVQNGMIVFGGQEVTLNSFHPDFFSRNICPFGFDAAADCPKFLNDLLAPALDKDDIKLIQKWAGAVLLGKNDAQRMLLMLGTPGGGKSTLMTILELTIGLSNVAQLRTEHLGKPFELFAFSGKTLLTGKDVLADFLSQKSASHIKSLVGGDLLDAEKKGFNQRLQIRGCFNVGITCNADLNIRLEGDAGAWKRRLMVVRYDRPPVTRRIPGYAEMLLREEGPGILRWMVEGAIELLNDLDEAGDYILTDAQKERVDKLLEQSESVKLFVRDRLIKGGETSMTTAELKTAYHAYCENQGMQPMHYQEVSAQLKRYMVEIHQKSERNDIIREGRSQRGFKDIRVRGEVGNED